MPLPQLVYWLYVKRVWDTLHEPRLITAIMVVCYLISLVAGIMILAPAEFPTILKSSYMIVEAVILILVGLVGAPAAWLGKWIYERVALIGFVAVPAILFCAVVIDLLFLPGEAVTQVTIGGGSGLLMWVALGLTRWQRIKSRPYAPGMGPVPVKVQTREVDAFVSAAEEAISRSCGRG